MDGEYSGLIVAALVLLVVLIATFMCIQLYYLRRIIPPSTAAAESFCGGDGGCGSDSRVTGAGCGGDSEYYAPPCDTSRWPGNRGRCHGFTTGAMPSIDNASPCYGGLCCGLLGIPP